MSRENVDRMRGIYEAMARGDFWGVGAVIDPEIEWEWSSNMAGLTGVAAYHGFAGVEAATRDWFEAWDWFRQEGLEFIEAGDDVIVLTRQHGRPKGSEREVESTGAEVWTFRGDKAVRFKAYDDPSKALEAAGLTD